MYSSLGLATRVVNVVGHPPENTPGPETSLLDFWPVLIPVLALIWGVREWIYGGSVLIVKLELGYSDGIQLVRGAPIDYVEQGAIKRRFDRRISNPVVDLAVVTVINRGRTAATVMNPGLSFVMRGVDPVFVGGILLTDFGGTIERVRIEAHDSRMFLMPLGGMVTTAQSDVDFQRAESMRRDLRARAQVTSGTGKTKRSRKWVWRGKWVRRADWAVRLPLRGDPLGVEEQLLADFVDSRSGLYDQSLVIGGVLLDVRAGKSDASIMASFPPPPAEIMKRTFILNRARALLDQSTAS